MVKADWEPRLGGLGNVAVIHDHEIDDGMTWA